MKFPDSSPRASGLLAILLSLTGGCLLFTPEPAPFVTLKRIELPSLPGRSEYRTIRQIRYLLPRSGTHQVENARAVEQALNGEWERAHQLWFSLPGEDDCALLNNKGISLSMRGRNREALQHLSRAYALCPENDPIRKNLMTVLDGGRRNKPRYYHRPNRSSPPAGKRDSDDDPAGRDKDE